MLLKLIWRQPKTRFSKFWFFLCPLKVDLTQRISSEIRESWHNICSSFPISKRWASQLFDSYHLGTDIVKILSNDSWVYSSKLVARSRNHRDALRFRQHHRAGVNWSKTITHNIFVKVSQLQQLPQMRVRCCTAKYDENTENLTFNPDLDWVG